MRVFHFFHGSLEHHNQPMLQLFKGQENNECDSVCFIVATDPHKKIVHSAVYDQIITTLKGYISFIRHSISVDDVVVIHGLYTNWHYLLPLLNPKLAPKVIWDVWGDDYYSVNRLISSNKLSDKIRYYFRRFAIPKFGAVAGFQKDVELVCKTFNFRNHQFEVNHPLRPALDNLSFESNLQNQPRKVLVGNSGSRSNEHVRGIEYLKKNKHFESLDIVCLFSTDTEHEYEKEFKTYLKDNKIQNVTIIKEMMSFPEFIAFIRSLGCIVLPHRRQQGVGTSNLSLVLGKPVYMDMNVATAKYYSMHNVQVFDIESLNNAEPSEWQSFNGEHNSDSIKSLFGIEAVKAKWQTIIAEFNRD